MWINFESTIRENSKSVKSAKINPQKKEKIIITKTIKKLTCVVKKFSVLIDFHKS